VADDKVFSKTIYLMLSASGGISLDEVYYLLGSDEPDLDPDIDLPSITIQELAENAISRIEKFPDEEDRGELERLLCSLNSCSDLVSEAIKRRDSKN